MSKNKTIKFVHGITGKSFADCRRLCKSLSWNEELIIMATIDDAFKWEVTATADILTPADEVAAILDAAEKGANND